MNLDRTTYICWLWTGSWLSYWNACNITQFSFKLRTLACNKDSSWARIGECTYFTSMASFSTENQYVCAQKPRREWRIYIVHVDMLVVLIIIIMCQKTTKQQKVAVASFTKQRTQLDDSYTNSKRLKLGIATVAQHLGSQSSKMRQLHKKYTP